MDLVVLHGAQPVIVTEADVFGHFGIRVRPLGSDRQYVLLTNVLSTNRVVLPDNRELPFSVTHAVRTSDLVSCDGLCIGFLPRPAIPLPWWGVPVPS